MSVAERSPSRDLWSCTSLRIRLARETVRLPLLTPTRACGGTWRFVLPNGRRATFYYVKRWPKLFRRDLTTVLSLLARGKIQAHIAHKLPLEQASDALGLLEFGKVTGKMALVPGLVAEEGTVYS